MRITMYECDGCRKRADDLEDGWMQLGGELCRVVNGHNIVIADAVFCSLECINVKFAHEMEPA